MRVMNLRRIIYRYRNYYLITVLLIYFISNYYFQHTILIKDDKYKTRDRNKNTKYGGLNDRSSPNLFLNEHEKWQPVGYSTNIHVYSAFLVDSYIRIIGAKLLNAGNQVVYCQFWYNNKQDPEMFVVRAIISAISEDHGLKYTSSFFNCKHPNKTYPYAVSLVPETHFKAKNKLFVNIQTQTKVNRNFTVCIQPLHFKYSRAFQLVEFIELNRILGADKFVFYNYSSSWNVDEVLWYYCKQNIVDLFQWQLPMRSFQWPPNSLQVEIHAYGQLASQNDCLYRYRNQSKYLVFLDVDEFIIPHKHKYWNDMMNDLPASFGEYNFRNTFFRKEWPDTNVNYTGKNIAAKYRLYSFLKFTREKTIYEHEARSKYMINPQLVEAVGIHSVQKFKTRIEQNITNPDIVKTWGERYNVNPEIGLLHHYRDWENPNDSIARIDDTEVLKYGKTFLNRVYQVWETLKNVQLGPFPIN